MYENHLERKCRELELIIKDAYDKLHDILTYHPQTDKDLFKDLYRLQSILENESTYRHD
jgi:hypothetical protein